MGVSREISNSTDYWDPDAFALEREKIFGRGWFLAGHLSEWAAPGDYKVLPFPGQSVVVLKQNDSTLKALSNHCLHRQTVLFAEERGRAKESFSCSYHGWRYSREGKLEHVPEAEGLNGPLEKKRLEEFVLRTSFGLVWLSPAAGATSFEAFVKDLEPIFSAFDSESFDLAHARSFPLGVNWKAVLENACEAYHIRAVHGNSVGRIDNQGDLRVKETPPHCLLTIPLGRGRLKSFLDFACLPSHPRLSEFERDHYHKIVITPNTILNITPLFFTVYQAWPDGPGACTLRYAFFRRRGLNVLARLRTFLTYLGSRLILNEDLEILAKFQEGQRYRAAGHHLHVREQAVDFLRREREKSLAR